MNKVVYISLLFLLLAGCNGIQINRSAKHHIFLQNRDIIRSTEIYLDQRLIFKGNVPSSSRMPPVVKSIPVDDFNRYKEIIVIYNNKKYSEALERSTVEILINYDFPGGLINQYDHNIKFK